MADRRRLGKYRLVRRIAVGGMAEVYLAVAEGLSGFEKRVVVKRLLPQHARDPELVAMFLDEARLMAALKHRHIAEVYDIGREQDDYFFAMEHVPGTDLREVLRALGGSPLPLGPAVAIGRALALALHHAHEQRDEGGNLLGVVHRDVSPSNVLLGAAGEVKLADFGVAKWSAQRSETQHGMLKGKCAYMSPEQCRALALDRRSDVFALGVLLYEMTTGAKPFDGASDFEILNAVVAGQAAPPSARVPDYPAALEAIVVRALQARAEDRQATMSDVERDLAAFAAVQGLASSEPETAAAIARLPGVAAGSRLADDEAAPQPADRTATDHFAAAEQRLGSRRRRALSAGVFALALGAGVVALLTRSDPGAAPKATPAPVAPARDAAPAPIAAPIPAVEPAPDASMPPVPPAAARKFGRAPRRPPPPKVWDPDSPVPP